MNSNLIEFSFSVHHLSFFYSLFILYSPCLIFFIIIFVHSGICAVELNLCICNGHVCGVNIYTIVMTAATLYAVLHAVRNEAK